MERHRRTRRWQRRRQPVAERPSACGGLRGLAQLAFGAFEQAVDVVTVRHDNDHTAHQDKDEVRQQIMMRDEQDERSHDAASRAQN